MDKAVILPTSSEPKEISAAATLIPYRRDDTRCKYLGYLACGFSDEESLFVLGLNRYWLELQREDDKFAGLEERIPELRLVLSKEYVELDFNRNFRMVLEIDHRILRKSLQMELVEDEDTGEMVAAELTLFEQQYLLKLRSAYTPQQLQLLEAVSKGNGGNFNFAEWVKNNQEAIQGGKKVEISRTDTISVRG